jgi:hypothetical protein
MNVLNHLFPPITILHLIIQIITLQEIIGFQKVQLID